MLGRIFALVAALLTCAQSAVCQYPEKPIRVVFPNKAGGGYHKIILAMQPYLEEQAERPIVIQAMPGAGTVAGTRFVANQKADGYTLLFIHEAALIASSIGRLGFPLTDRLEPLARIVKSCPATFARADAPYSNLTELAAYARENDRPIKGAVNVGATSHVEMLTLGRSLGFKPRIVHAGGGGAARLALLSKDVDLSQDNPSGVRSLMEAGTLKALAYYGDERHPAIPATPTMAEQGYETPEAMCNTGYLWIRRNAPSEAKEFWRTILREVTQSEEIEESLEKTLGVDILYQDGLALSESVEMLISGYSDSFGSFPR